MGKKRQKKEKERMNEWKKEKRIKERGNERKKTNGEIKTTKERKTMKNQNSMTKKERNKQRLLWNRLELTVVIYKRIPACWFYKKLEEAKYRKLTATHTHTHTRIMIFNISLFVGVKMSVFSLGNCQPTSASAFVS